jgi:two-component system cell cycle response regulator DivK
MEPGRSRPDARKADVSERCAPIALVVDDDPDGREMYATTLRAAGFEVEEAADGFEANDKAFRLRPAVILMDLLMPRLDGWEVVGWLKKNPATRGIPIVAITGATPEQAELARQAGCAAVLVKPCAPERVLAEIDRVRTPARD